MLDILMVLGIMWSLAHLTHRYLVKEADILAALLVAFAFALLAPIFHLFLAVLAAALFETGFEPEHWFRYIPMVAASSGIITFLTVLTSTKPTDGDDDHIQRKL